MSDRVERLRDRAHGQIVQILRFGEALTEETTIEAIKTRLEALETRYNAFNEMEDKLFENPNYQSITPEVDEVYYRARELLTKACGQRGKNDEANTNQDLNTTLEQFFDQQKTFYEGISSSQQARLPKINIEPFSGDYNCWPSFHDLFKTTVHNNRNLSGAHKLQILKGLLKDEAASLIRHISVTDTNYAEAWEKLCNRYNKMTSIISTLVQTFMEQKPCSRSNGRELRRISEKSDEVLRGLRVLGNSAETRDPWLIHIILGKIDEETKQLWANESVGVDFPTFENFLNFLNKRCDALEICESASKRTVTRSATKSFITMKSAGPNTTLECVVCRQSHPMFKCYEFKNMGLDARLKTVSHHNLCLNCLRKGHVSAKCFSKSSCLICRKKHHTLLHQDKIDSQPGFVNNATNHHILMQQSPAKQPSETKNEITEQSTSYNTADVKGDQINTKVLHTLYASTTTVLPTAMIYIKSRTGQLQLYRALLDSGSQTSFVTEYCAQSLGLERSHSFVSVYGLASTSAGKTRGTINMTIQSRTDQTYQLTTTAHIIKNITSLLPTRSLKFNNSILKLELADPEFYTPNKIDVLLGADIFFEVLNPEKHIVDDSPILQSSKLGWLVAGSYNNINSSCQTSLHITTEPLLPITNDDLHNCLQKFWEVEEITSQCNPTAMMHETELFYEETTIRTEGGRFKVKLPFKKPSPLLGNSYNAAYHRLLAMERKFTKAPELYEEYKAFMDEYSNMGHMSRMSTNTIPVKEHEKFYLPHHAVVKPSSSTTKLRVVFDGSCKSSTGISLNDILQTGPNLQRELSTIILTFRKHAVVFVADIEKMYRQILVDDDDANYQLILWRNHPRDQIETYKLNTVTYGTACAPFLAVKTLKRSALTAAQLYPQAAQVIDQDFYVDDLLTGCDTVTEAIQLKDEITKILDQSGFYLRKWKSNSKCLLNSFSQHDINHIPKLIENDTTSKTLGIVWNAERDIFSFKVQQDNDQTNWTKRKILSAASKLYDPLGWLAPTIILFKILLQKIWLLKLEWDAEVPNDVTNYWQEIYRTLPALESIEIPRHLTPLPCTKRLQLHAFCDASELAYGAVLYLRSINDQEEVSVNIISAKSKVAPIKQISLPRLELCGAVLLCKLMKTCLESLSYSNIEVYGWTDSMIVLHWLSDVPRRWKSFIGNRTATIIETIPRARWQHVDSKHNPADVISRGVKPNSLCNLNLWWNGPKWLSKSEDHWPTSTLTDVEISGVMLEERSKFVKVFTELTQEDNIVVNLVSKFSSWLKIRKVMVYILRFGRRRQHKSNTYQNNAVTPTELEDAETVILRNIQQSSFKTELDILASKSPLSSKHHLSSLDPFIDVNSVLRVGGRLSKSSLPHSTKHPVILPKNHKVCEIIVRDVHLNNMHAGNSLTLSIIRSKYWMIGARYIIKRCIKNCTICVRHRYHKLEQKMADLPEVRCNQHRPFLNTGLDYAGPLYIKRSKRNTAPVEKAYVAVFVCLAVKAVHLEVVSSLDTDSFLSALRRFIARRGAPQQIWCDNGSNFVGANRELKTMKEQILNQTSNPLIFEFLLQKGIHFQFNPPHAPHFGGLWESSVRSFKYHLKRVTNTNLTFEEMTTLIIQIEGLLNSRPLCRLNDDPADLEVITPAHFLVGESLTTIPEPMLEVIPQNKLSRWQNIQKRIQGFWKRWHQDYLTTIQQRFKWKNSANQLQINDIVLIKEDNLYPSQWLLGKVTAVHPGTDGIVRVVTLKTSKNEIKRPVHRLIKLPVK